MDQVVGSQLCVILAGGLGTRLRSAIGDLPKSLAPVGHRTFLELQIIRLAEAGITGVALSLGHRATDVIDATAQMVLPIPTRYVQEPKPLGTGGAIQYTLDTLGLDEVLVANGDTFLDGDLSAMLEPLRRDSGELVRMAAVNVPDRSRFGGIITGKHDKVVGFLEKGQSGAGLINAGLYRLCRQAFSGHAGTYSLEQQLLPILVEQGHVTLAQLDGSFIDIGVPDDYKRFCAQHAD